MNTLRELLRDESGATAIEYGLIAALVSVVIIVVLTALGESLTATFQSVADGLEGAAAEPPPAP
jgi:pilus assembly protein Flp/PilA